MGSSQRQRRSPQRLRRPRLGLGLDPNPNPNPYPNPNPNPNPEPHQVAGWASPTWTRRVTQRQGSTVPRSRRGTTAGRRSCGCTTTDQKQVRLPLCSKLAPGGDLGGDLVACGFCTDGAAPLSQSSLWRRCGSPWPPHQPLGCAPSASSLAPTLPSSYTLPALRWLPRTRRPRATHNLARTSLAPSRARGGAAGVRRGMP